MNLDSFIRQHGLPSVFAESADQCYLPFAEWLEAQLARHKGSGFVLGINGAQGTGKSTLAALLREYLEQEHGRRVVILSIDDLYLTLAEREALGRDVHPLLRTRGVPGTHDVALGLSIIEQLKTLKAGDSVQVPRFDKSRDDRYPPAEWSTISGPVDLIIFEGWCVASQAVPETELKKPVNELESAQDKDGRWRSYVNDRLATDYKRLFACLDALLFLQVPDFGAVRRWRIEQEHKLRQRSDVNANAIMSDAEVASFIRYYERITRNNIDVLPTLANAVIRLNDNHQPVSLNFPRSKC